MNATNNYLSVSDDLLDLAFTYKQTKLWKKLFEDQIFAIQDSKKKLYYCSILGHDGRHCALTVYPGQSGLDSYRKIREEAYDLTPEYEYHEYLLSQDCLMLSLENKEFLHPRNVDLIRDYCHRTGKALRGKNAYPGFLRYRPGFHPWHITEKSEAEILQAALEAAIEVSEKLKSTKPQNLGFIETVEPGNIIPLLVKNKNGKFQWQQTILPNAAEPEAPKAVLNDISAARIKKKRKNHCPWGVHLFMHLDAVADDNIEKDGSPLHAPFYPFILMIINEKSGIVLNCAISRIPNIDVKTLSQALISTIDDQGRPDIFYCIDQRTADFLSDFSKKSGIKVLMREEDPMLEEALDAFTERFMSDDLDMAEDEMMEEMMMILSSPELVKQMPDEILLSAEPLLSYFPSDIQRILSKELSKRHLQIL